MLPIEHYWQCFVLGPIKILFCGMFTHDMASENACALQSQEKGDFGRKGYPFLRIFLEK